MEIRYKKFINYALIIGVIAAVIVYLPVVLEILIKGFGFFYPFITGLALAFVLNVLMGVIENKLVAKLKLGKGQRAASLLLTFVTVVVGMTALVVLVLPELKDTFAIVSHNLPIYWERIQSWLKLLNLDILSIYEMDVNWDYIAETAYEFLSKGSGGFFTTTIGITSSILGVIINLLLGLVFSIYILLQKETLSRQMKKLLYAFLKEKTASGIIEVAALSNDIFSKFIKGQFFEAFIIGVLCFLGMTIFSMPYAVAISAMVGFGALIPVFGAFIGTAAGVFLIVMVSPIQALWFVVFIVVLQQLEGNLIYPRVVGSSIGLPGIWVLLAVTIGAAFGGILGMLVGVPLTSVAYSLLRKKVKQRTKLQE
ncbi:MAG: AI-2E family transporter [Tissierellales bacterium]|nr:AI-2E family transporter [Tissierellales bacterium]MBN2826634.1 AI-2E family transporter [Tissierellales bacterium]